MESDAHEGDLSDVVDAFVRAGRVLVAVAVESLEKRSDMSLSQFRVLVLLNSRGKQKVVALADALRVNPSTATRLCDQLVRRDLVKRERSAADRREVLVHPTPEGEALVDEVLSHRRERISGILSRVAPEERKSVVSVLNRFSDAAGDVPDQPWSVGW